ncbi:MAG TPA: hypothetical protein ENJ56_04385, partial [Anaerolineae bacterium]|nr:hypothetical protein [Anaerolineae bacterium]
MNYRRVIIVALTFALTLTFWMMSLVLAETDSGTDTIIFQKTVGIDPTECASEDSIDIVDTAYLVPRLYYCYKLTNDTDMTFTLHDVVDTELGAVLTAFPHTLSPNASFWITRMAYVYDTAIISATWTAYTPTGTTVLSATDSVTVTVFPTALDCDKQVDFEQGIPRGWYVTNNGTGSNPAVWTTTADTENCSIENLTNGSGVAACVDSDIIGFTGGPYDTSLVSNPFVIPVPVRDSVYISLTASIYYRSYAYDEFTVDVWDGWIWHNLLTWNEDHQEDIAIDLLPYWGGLDGFQVRFRYQGNGRDWYAEVDN